MPHQCPKCQHPYDPSAPRPTQCAACGLVFAKYEAMLAARQAAAQSTPVQADDTTEADQHTSTSIWRERLLEPWRADEPVPDSPVWWGRALAWLVLLVWGVQLIWAGWRSGEPSILHLVDLAFHEFGHIAFRPFGEFMTILGGSLFQCLVPVLLGAVFVYRHHNRFAGSVCLWWLGQNFTDLAPYIGDARALAMPLTGEHGGEEIVAMRAYRHDWHNILGDLGLLQHDHLLANLAHGLGSLVMLLALGGAAWLLWQQYQARQAQ